jgi:hypothetical protein
LVAAVGGEQKLAGTGFQAGFHPELIVEYRLR